MQEYIKIRGARENNLKDISLDVPKRKITVFTGVSGSGKSSIVFDTIAQESGRQLNQNFPAFVQTFLPKYNRPEYDELENLSMTVAIDQKRHGGNVRSTLGTITDINPLLRLLYSRMNEGEYIPASSFSFNDIHGMCKECSGVGELVQLDLNAAIDFDLSLNDGAILLPGFKIDSWQWKAYAQTGFFDCDKAIKDYNKEELDKFLYAKPEKIDSLFMEGMASNYEGLVYKFNRTHINNAKSSDASRKKMEKYLTNGVCTSCNGKRLNDEILAVTIKDMTIADLCDMQINQLYELVKNINDEKVKPIVTKLLERLEDLIGIGLDYLSLSRLSSTLSGGESQRVKMIKHLSSGLIDVVYIFDEPSIGLHPRDVHRLNEMLVKLRDKGNTVIVVEHDPDVIKVADHIVDVGPRAGIHGGEIMFTGSYDDLLSSDTLTGNHLNTNVPFKQDVRTPREFISSKPSSKHNLKNESIDVPVGLFTTVTGVAGSGKSTIVSEFIKEQDNAVVIDQSTIGANIRSNPATYSGIMTEIRKLFANANDVAAGMFSYNSEGACEECSGHGIIKSELAFMDDIEMVCPTCNGMRYKLEVLDYKFQDKTIVGVLNMTIEEAIDFFELKKITNKLINMRDVGLSYMTLGQSLTTLSGGECQRLKLASELNKKGNIYIMDEPTTGLHMSDIKFIIDIIERLVEKGNTVLVIEHNTDVMRSSDWLIDIGIDGGINGGKVIYNGKPIDIVEHSSSITGKYIK